MCKQLHTTNGEHVLSFGLIEMPSLIRWKYMLIVWMFETIIETIIEIE